MTEKELKLTKGIHHLVRGDLTWVESWELMSGVVESDQWIRYWELEVLLIDFFNDDDRGCHG